MISKNCRQIYLLFQILSSGRNVKVIEMSSSFLHKTMELKRESLDGGKTGLIFPWDISKRSHLLGTRDLWLSQRCLNH